MAVAQNTYSRGDLIDDVAAQNPGVSKKQIDAILRSAMDQIATVTASGRRVELRGFAVFEVKDSPERQGRNPATGETITIAAHRRAVCKIKFKV